LRDVAEVGVAILMSSNDPLDGLRHADRILLMSAGPAARIVANHANVPAPDVPGEALSEAPLRKRIEAALWGEDA
jgi:ABC-type cobalamin transport system ATPase subunit